MSSRFASEQLASLRHDAQRLVEQAGDQEDHALTLLAEDVNLASRSPARLLITASTPQAVETLARRIHGIGARAQFPFVEEVPSAAQDALIDLLAALESARRPSAAVRLISGTTVSLLDRVAAGTFSERLFYRLNIIHLMAGAAPAEVTIT
jgi:DNA-binding NtrC family response regulator